MNSSRGVKAERFVRPDRVEHLTVGLSLTVQVRQDLELLPVQMLVFQRSESAFPNPFWPGLLRRVLIWTNSVREAMNAANACPLNAPPLSVTS